MPWSALDHQDEVLRGQGGARTPIKDMEEGKEEDRHGTTGQATSRVWP